MEISPILSALRRSKTGPLLVAIQVALSMAILANALHIVSLRLEAAARPSGIAREADVFFVDVNHIASDGAEQALANQQLETEALRALPGTLSVANLNQTPLSQSGSYNSVAVDRKQLAPSAHTSYYLTPDSLVATLGLKLVEGRDLGPDDVVVLDPKLSMADPPVVLITRPLARKLFAEQSAVGREMYFGTGPNAGAVRIVGVVERLQTPGAQTGPDGEYSTIAPVRVAVRSQMYAVRTEPGQRDRVMKDAEAAMRKLYPSPIILDLQAMDEVRSERYRNDRALSWMLVVVSGLLLLVTATGIVGMASLWVTQRRKQIGIRRALGGRRIDILRYFITENVLITSAGIVAGALLSIGLNQLLVSRLEMTKLPLAYVATGSCVFWVLGILAVYGPAWRAASTSPALATRSA